MAGLLRQMQQLRGPLSRGVPSGFGGVAPIAPARFSSTAVAAVQAEATPTAKKPKAEKADKKPPSAYARFVKDNFASIAAQNPDKKGVGQIGKVIGAEWSKLSDAEKAKYKSAADAARAQWDAEHPGKEKGTRTAKKKKSDRPLTAYNVYMKQRIPEVRAKSGDATKDVLSQVAKEWSGLSQKEKDKYKPAPAA